MPDGHDLDAMLAPIVAWARTRSDILGLMLVGSWARGSARPDSDIDLIVLATQPHAYRYDENWLAEIRWFEGRVAGWHDADYGSVWSRHVSLAPAREVEFTFCSPSWAATDPPDPGTVHVVSSGCRILLDKARLFERLRAMILP